MDTVSTNSNDNISQSHIFVTLLILLWSLILCFVGYQYTRERQYRISMLDSNLQQLNHHFADELNIVGSPSELFARNSERYKGLRITLLDTLGYVIYDSKGELKPEVSKIENEEICEALESGEGFFINKNTSGVDSIYSATNCGGMIVRSSLPYEITLTEVLGLSKSFLVIAIIISLLISWIGYITSRLYAQLKQTSIDLDREHTLKEQETSEKIRIKRQLTNNINHELKTPICSILGYLDMIIHNPALTSEQVMTFACKSYDQAERLRHLMSDLSTITRIDEASEIIECETVNITRMVDDIIDDVCPQAQQQSIEVESNLSGNVEIEGNNSLIYSIFRNLVDNAIAYSGGRRVWIELIKDGAESYYFVVRDNGIGIEKKHLGYIFERFYRVDKGRSRKLGGTGLGLSIVKNAVLFHGGTIEAKVSPRGGAEFYFSLRKVNGTKKNDPEM